MFQLWKEMKMSKSVTTAPLAGVRWWLPLFDTYLKLKRRTSSDQEIRERVVLLNWFFLTIQ